MEKAILLRCCEVCRNMELTFFEIVGQRFRNLGFVILERVGLEYRRNTKGLFGGELGQKLVYGAQKKGANNSLSLKIMRIEVVRL